MKNGEDQRKKREKRWRNFLSSEWGNSRHKNDDVHRK